MSATTIKWESGMDPIRLDASEALPCPFCGVQPEIQFWHGGGPGKRLIACNNDPGCDVLPSTTGPSRRAALTNWNTRR